METSPPGVIATNLVTIISDVEDYNDKLRSFHLRL